LFKRLLVATTNPGKLREIRELLRDVPVDLASLNDIEEAPAPEETG
jgi:XTP/dITP diphosphohydrolase